MKNKKQYLFFGVFMTLVFFGWGWYQYGNISLKTIILAVLCGALSTYFSYLFNKVADYFKTR